MRFDPIWRRIKGDAFTAKFEGRFGDRLSRLEGLNNWGVLGWLYPHASASKLTHHYGVEHNACEYLDGGTGEREKYRASFRTAAHVMHWGHLPLSYAAEEALLRAAHVDAGIGRLVDGLMKDVKDAGELQCDALRHDCFSAVRQGDRYYELYRWLSAWLVVSDWKRLWKAVKDACDETPNEQETKREVIRTLVCREHRGHRILSMCNRADFVPRDLLQAGTAWLSFDLEALWETNPLGSDAAKEWSLVSAAEEYLDRRFFRVPDSLLVHSLAARAIAGGFVAEGLTRDAIKTLLKEDDAYYAGKLKSYHRKRLADVTQLAMARRIPTRWEHVGSWDGVSLPAGSRFEMEDFLTERSGTATISYPFTQGLNVFVEGDRSELPRLWAGPGRALATVHLHHERTGQRGGDIGYRTLNVASKIAPAIAPGHEPGNALMSWLLEQPTSQNDEAVGRVAAEILGAHEEKARTSISNLLALKTVEQLVEGGPPWLSFIRSFADGRLPGGVLQRFGSYFLRLPWALTKQPRARPFITLLRDEALKLTSGGGASRGYALEVAAIADQWLATGDPQQRFVFFNCYMLGKDQQPEKEFDVVRIDLNPDKSWHLTAVECSVARSGSKDNEGREKLDLLRGRLQGRFSDLASYTTLFAEPHNGSLSYEDAARGFSAQH